MTNAALLLVTLLHINSVVDSEKIEWPNSEKLSTKWRRYCRVFAVSVKRIFD